MAYAKVILNGTTLMDVTQDTVDAANLLSGETATRKDGVSIIGEATGGTLISKTIAANGTYSASDDDADGYSEVTVNVSSDNREDLCDPLDVDFIDYDGRLLYSYTAQEFLTLESLPPNPTNEGLTAQGWNWTLANAKEYVGQYGVLVVGQSYVTDDGKTRAYIHITKDQIDISAPFYINLYCLESGGGTIHWGDGTTSSIPTQTGTRSLSHVYSAVGDYIVEVDITSGSYSLGVHQSHNCAFGNPGSNTTESRCLSSVKKVEIGNRITGFGRQPFHGCANIESVSIPITLTKYNDTGASDGSTFESNAMRGVVFPSGFQGKTSTMFGQGAMLRYIASPKSMTIFSINSSVLSNFRKLTLAPQSVGTTSRVKLNYSRQFTHLIMPGDYTTLASVTIEGSIIKKFTIPATVTTIQTEALMYNYYLMELHVLPTTVPTMANVRALNGLNPNCIIYVPYSEDHSILEAYKTASNWSTFSAYMQEEPQ